MTLSTEPQTLSTEPQTHAPVPASEVQPLAVSPREAARLVGLSPPSFYGLLHAGRIHSVKVGARRLVSVASLRAFIDGEPS